MLSFRRALGADFEAIRELLTEGGLNYPLLTEAIYRNLLVRDGRYCFVALHAGKVVGSVFGSLVLGGMYGYVDKLVVHPAYQRGGVGHSLVSSVLDQRDEDGISVDFTHIEKTNDQSIRLFKGNEFTIRATHYLLGRGYKK